MLWLLPRCLLFAQGHWAGTLWHNSAYEEVSLICVVTAVGWKIAHKFVLTILSSIHAGTSIAEVDASLTTGELQELLEKYGQGDLKTLPSGRGDNILSLLMSATQQQQQQEQEPLRVPEPVMHAQLGSSGGYADYIFAAAAAELFGVDVSAAAADGSVSAAAANGSSSSSSKLPWKVLRNADMQELQLLNPDGQPLLRFALAYGFRNIQTIVRQIKMGRCPYDYVEVMACPSGCLNGGGQIKAPKGVTTAQLVEQLEVQYFRQQAGLGQQQQQQQQQLVAAAAAGDQQQQYRVAPGSIKLLLQQQQQQQQQQGPVVPSCIDGRSLAAVYDVVLGGGVGNAAVEQLLHTQYHKREKTVTSTISDW
jgi:iron only hydrogenase large subunit-like protein